MSDVNSIEFELKSTLPAAYRDTLLNYPFPSWSGSDDCPLFDNAEGLIECNRQYHDGFAGMPAWPESLLFIGNDGAASTYAIDREDSQLRVLFLDHGHPHKVLESYESFDSWIDEIRNELGDSLDEPPCRPVSWQRVLLLSVVTVVIASFIGHVLSRLIM
jgi:hypothetical protein